MSPFTWPNTKSTFDNYKPIHLAKIMMTHITNDQVLIHAIHSKCLISSIPKMIV
ncbi:hypothetical protein F383_24867 [Gossypium arboreum]|uniref:Uncharacterized protein n=1 Tax=Gossypium arboreum TaxID=29729 RepID=A0A0B0P3Y8_GOSAR|nr:hypothetical protein F383_24867 [Gossypium arboreum]